MVRVSITNEQQSTNPMSAISSWSKRKRLTTRVLAADVTELSLTEGRAVSNDGMRLVYSALTAPNQSQVFLFDGRENSVRQLTQLGSRAPT